MRRTLPHRIPDWVEPGSLFFITVCGTVRGSNQFYHPKMAAVIFESVAHRHAAGEWFVRLVLLMPDHLHALLAFSPQTEMGKSIRLRKGYLARQHGVRWQRDFFDHRIRSDESWEEKAHYIRMNPVRAGLLPDETTRWPYVWEPE